MRLWIEDAGKNIQFQRGKDMLDDFTRLLQRIEPLRGDKPIFRGEFYSSAMDISARIQMFRDTYAVMSMGESFSLKESVAKRFATGKTPYELIIVCKKHATMKPIYEIAKKVMPKFAHQGEVVAMEGVRFRAVGEPLVTIDETGRKQIYLEVEEVLP